MICSDAGAENPNGKKMQRTEVYSTNLAADIWLAKMVAGLLSHTKQQFYFPAPSKIIGIRFTFITKIPGDTLLTKMPVELPSTEQIFTETSRLVSLLGAPDKIDWSYIFLAGLSRFGCFTFVMEGLKKMQTRENTKVEWGCSLAETTQLNRIRIL